MALLIFFDAMRTSASKTNNIKITPNEKDIELRQ